MVCCLLLFKCSMCNHMHYAGLEGSMLHCHMTSSNCMWVAFSYHVGSKCGHKKYTFGSVFK